MFSEIRFESDINEQFYFNELIPDTTTGWSPVNDISFEPQPRSDEEERMQDMGLWPSYTYFGKMLIHLEGDLIGESPEVTNQYSLRLMNVCMPYDPGFQINKHVGNFYVVMDGHDEMLYVECGIEDSPKIVRKAFYPCVLPFQITFKAYRPYFTGVDSGEKVWVA